MTWCRCGHTDADHRWNLSACMCCGCPELRSTEYPPPVCTQDAAVIMPEDLCSCPMVEGSVTHRSTHAYRPDYCFPSRKAER